MGKELQFEYVNVNEMEELGSSNAYVEFMQVFQRFDQQAAAKMEQASKDTSMQAADDQLPGEESVKVDGNEDDLNEGQPADSAGNRKKGGKSGAEEAKMTKKQKKLMAQMKIFDLKM